MKTKFKILSTMALLGTLVGITACGQNPTSSDSTVTSDTQEVKDEYTVTYDLNYEGSSPRVVTVKNGRRATNWKATRAGYTLDGWYLDKEGNVKFDFLEYVTSDLTLYAKWNKNAEKRTVTFNFNYDGINETASITIDEGNKISTALIPTCPRMGYEFEGWYKDQACTQKWSFETDVVKGDLTLYAKYKFDSSIARNEDGSIKYENTVVNVWVGCNFNGTKSYVETLAKQFNKDHLGEITVNVTTELNQNIHSLRIQQTPGMNSTYSTYYTASDVLALANINFDKTDFYANSIRENYINGKLYSLPLSGSIPYLVYNKELMNKYNIYDHLPSNYTEFVTVLQKAYEGEVSSNSEFKSIVSNASWTFKECASQTAFLQNDAEYYSYKNNEYVNEWGEDNKNAITALTNFAELFSVGGKAHGQAGVNENEWVDNAAIDNVEQKKSLIGLVNMGVASNGTVAGKLNNIGVMPLSGLFADNDKQNKNQIPMHQLSLEFYKAKDVSMTQIAAGAVFADYLSKNSSSLTKAGWYPLRKSVVESNEVKNSNVPAIKLLQSVGDPNNFRTLDGHSAEKSIINTTVAETYLPEVYYWENMSSVETMADSIKSAIKGQL